jgi:hypothetical protein
MKQLLILLAMFITSCNSSQPGEQQQNKPVNDKHSVATLQLNGGQKWKVDEPTRKNVAAMVRIVNDRSYQDSSKRNELYASIQSQIDTLVKECRMKGPEHDALHVWLEKVLKDVKDLKRDEYTQAFAALAKDVNSFYDYFE